MKKQLQKPKHEDAIDTPIIAWDGEGENINNTHRLTLLANSKGDLLLDKERTGKITYTEWLPFITKYHKAINVWYSFQYDINMIFKDLPHELKIQLFQEQKKTEIEDCIVKYIPRKILTIKKKKNTYTHYDVFGFFQTSFIKTLEGWNIPIPQIIEEGKKLRSDFTQESLDFITKYNFAECEKLEELVTKLRNYMIKANIPPLRSWHGAGAIASRFLKDWQFEYHKTNLLPTKAYQSLFNARKYSYFGGRSELFLRGLINNEIYQYDINSAYPNACRFIPSLHDKEWIYLSEKNIHKLKENYFAVVHVKWNLPPQTRVGPLPFRMNDNTIIFPRSGEGWYHNIEVQTAIKRGYKIKILEAWYLEPPYVNFLQAPIEVTAHKRLELKKQKDLGHLPIKLGLNALYGKIAQRPLKRDDGTYKYGTYTDLFLAGYITAFTRSQILDAVDFNNVIMIATDGIFSLTPLKVNISNNLGDWEYTHHKNGNFLMSGIYALQNKNNEWKLKTRGYTSMEYKHFIKIHKQQIQQEEVEYLERRFISIRLALRSPKYHQAEFETIPRIINWNNNKKRIFKLIESETSDSITVDHPLNQKESKMYDPYLTTEEIVEQQNLDLQESIGEDEI